MVLHLWYFIASLSATPVQNILGIWRSCCASASLGFPRVLDLCFLGVPFPDSLAFFVGGSSCRGKQLLACTHFLFSALSYCVPLFFLAISLHSRADWSAPGTCRTWQYWLYHGKYFFIPSYWIRRSEVLSKSYNYYLWLTYINVPIIYWYQRSIVAKVLFLEMTIYHPYYLVIVLQTCRIGCDHSALRIYKKLDSWLYIRVINWFIILKLSRLVQDITILLWIYLILRWIEVPVYLAWLHGTFSNRGPCNNCC